MELSRKNDCSAASAFLTQLFGVNGSGADGEPVGMDGSVRDEEERRNAPTRVAIHYDREDQSTNIDEVPSGTEEESGTDE